MKKFTKLGLIALVVLIIVSGCSSKSVEALKELGKDEEATIKVMYIDESFFLMKYGNLFKSKFPNIEVEVVSALSLFMDTSGDPMKAFREFIDEHQPDVLMLNPQQYRELAQNGELYELSGVIHQDGFDLDGMLPSVIELLKEKGDGGLYGLAPSFFSQALFYNVDLFNEYNIPYPQNGMTWEELINLAKLFPTDGDEDERIYGLHLSSFGNTNFELIHSIGATYGLNYVNPEEERVIFDNDSWKEVYEMAIDALRSGIIPQVDEDLLISFEDIEDLFKQEKFLIGNAAMTINPPLMDIMMEQAKSFVKDIESFHWEVVTVPIDPMDPNKTYVMDIEEIFGINANSSNLRAAWEFVKYVNSEEMAKIQTQSMDGSLQTRTQFIKNKGNKDFEAFYSLKPNYDYMDINAEIPQAFFGSIAEIIERETKDVLDEKISIETAIQNIQAQGQQAYIKAIEDQEKED